MNKGRYFSKLASKARSLLRRAGFDLIRYKPGGSSHARLKKFFEHFDIDLVLDVGANRGQYGRLLREIGYDGYIISFEPLASPYRELKELSVSDKRWQVAPKMALGASNKDKVEINISKNSVSSSLLHIQPTHVKAEADSAYVGVETVRMRKLDDFLEDLEIDVSKNIFLKLDAQGYEKEILKGSKRHLDEFWGLQVEPSLVRLYEGAPLFQEMITWLEARRFKLWTLFPGFINEDTGQLLQMDGIFVRSEFMRD